MMLTERKTAALTYQQQADVMRALARGDEYEAQKMLGLRRPISMGQEASIFYIVADTPLCPGVLQLPL